MTYGRNMVHIRLLHHRGHCFLDGAVTKLIVSMLIPDFFQIKEWTPEMFLKKPQTASVSHSCCRYLERRMAGNDEIGRVHIGVDMDCLSLLIRSLTVRYLWCMK